MTNNTIYELTNIVKNAMANQLNVQLDGKPYESYEVKIITEHSYTINARSKDEAVLKAIRKYDAEGKSKEPVPAYGTVTVNGEEYGTEEDDDITLFYEDSFGYSSDDIYGTIAGIVEDIAERYRLTDEEAEELEEEIETHIRIDGESEITYELPYVEISVYKNID